MLYWSLQSAHAHPSLLAGTPPPGLLSAAEQVNFDRLTSLKRRHDWLLGRWTAKHLLRAVLRQRRGIELPLPDLEMFNNADRVPYALAGGEQFSLSISHAGDHALCALLEHPDWPLGADIERIEARAPVFAADYFTAAENALLAIPPAERVPALVTAIWSAKEAALKALRLGLSVDTRAVTCLIEPRVPPLTAWNPFTIEVDPHRLPRPAPPLIGWWRMGDAFVLTLVTQPFPGQTISPDPLPAIKS